MRPRLFLSLLQLPVAGAMSVSSSALPALEPGWPAPTGYSVSQSGVAAQLDADATLEVAISSQDGKLYVFNHDGTLRPGWPQYMGDALWPDQWVNQCSSPAVHDLNNDGTPEIIVGNFDAKLYVFEPDGSRFPGFPFQAGFMIFSTPAIGDIDGDTRPEIVFGANDGGIYALNDNGTLCAGFPYMTPYVVRSSPALGDLDGDGDLEIVCSADNSDYQLYALRGDGTNMPGFPKYLWQSGAVSSPSLGDIDFDGDLEIAVGARDGTIHVMHHDGQYLPGWPFDAGYSCGSSPTLANLDLDHELEIVIGMNDSRVWAFNHDATSLPGWPRSTSYTVVSSASVGDLDGDGELEIVIGENTGLVYGWNVDGSDVAGFPLQEPTYTIYSSPLLSDLDLDGHLELLIGCMDTKVYCWDLGPGTYDPAELPWPKWRLDARNTATVPAMNPEAVEDASSTPGAILTVGPNPFSTLVRIRFDQGLVGRRPINDSNGAALPPLPAVLAIHDPAGRTVRTFSSGLETGVGSWNLSWDGLDDAGRAVPSGTYLVRLTSGARVLTARAVLLR